MQKDIWRNLTRKPEKSSQNWEIWELLLVIRALWSTGGGISPVAPVCSCCLWQIVVSILSHSLFLSPSLSLSLPLSVSDSLLQGWGAGPSCRWHQTAGNSSSIKAPSRERLLGGLQLRVAKGQLEEEGGMDGWVWKKETKNNNEAAATSQKGAVDLKA